MNRIFIARVVLPRIFKINSVPVIAKLYGWALAERRTPVLLDLFNKFFYQLLFLFIQRFYPFRYQGSFLLISGKQTEKIYFNAKNAQFDALYRPTFAQNGYEPELTTLLFLLINREDILYDIGSNWGYYSLLAAAKPHFRGTVYAFEPFPSTFQDLVSVVKQTSFQEKIRCFPVALSDKNGQTTMRFSGVLQSGFAYIPSVHEDSILSPHAQVQTKTLDSLDLPDPTIIKIDAQFHEAAIFRGGKNMLRRTKPLIILENCINFNKTDETVGPLSLLEKAGYLFFFPCFVTGNKDKQFIPSEADRTNYFSETLALVEFDRQERFLYRDTINIFAVPKEKLNIVNAKFKAIK